MNRILSGASASIPIGGVVQLVEPQPGFVRCDGKTTYLKGQIYNDLFTTTLLAAGAGLVGTSPNVATSGAAVLAYAGSGTFKRTLDGVNWSACAVPPALPANYNWTGPITWDGTRWIIFGGSSVSGNDGIYFSTSTDNGATWSAYGVARASTASGVTGLAGCVSNTSSGVTLVWTYNTSGNCLKYNGAAWSACGASVPGSAAGFLPFGANSFMSPTQRSTDGGATWSSITIPSTLATLQPVLGTPAGTVIARGDGAGTPADKATYLRSTDAGATWTFADAPSAGTGGGTAIPINQGCQLGTKLYLGLMESADDGLTWSRRGAPAGAAINKYVVIGTNVLSVHATAGMLFSGARTGIGISPFVDSGSAAAEFYMRVS